MYLTVVLIITCRTPYTRVPRYTYIDPDYSFSLKEARDREQHKQSYINYNRDSQAQRLWKKREKLVQLRVVIGREHLLYLII